MQYGVRFGRGGVVMHKLCAWLEDGETESVLIFTDGCAPITFLGTEAARFVRYVHRRSIDSECEEPPTIHAAEPIRDGSAGRGKGDVKRTAQ